MKRTILVLTLTLLLFTSNANAAENNPIGDLDIRADNTILSGAGAAIVTMLVATVY